MAAEEGEEEEVEEEAGEEDEEAVCWAGGEAHYTGHRDKGGRIRGAKISDTLSHCTALLRTLQFAVLIAITCFKLIQVLHSLRQLKKLQTCNPFCSWRTIQLISNP